MRIFISYRHTGETNESLQGLLQPIIAALRDIGHDPICTFFDEHNRLGNDGSPRAMMQQAFGLIDDCQALFVVQHSEQKSEGMLIEVGYCIAKSIPIVVASNHTVKNTYLPSMATASISYRNIDELTEWITNDLDSQFS